MQTADNPAQNVRGLIIGAVCDHPRKRGAALGTLQQQRLMVMGQHRCRSLPRPPGHQLSAGLLFGLLRDFKHGRLPALADRQQITIARSKGLTLDGQLPLLQPGREQVVIQFWIIHPGS